MKISCLCPTYRRPELLEEAIESFLRQDHPDKELIIVNDEPEQKLIFAHPSVRIINCEKRAPDLATKYNYAASMASGDILVPWDDDDVFLPWRLTDIAKNNVNGAWYSDLLFSVINDGEMVPTRGKVHCNHAFTPQLLIRFGAYHNTKDLSFDFAVFEKLRVTIDKPTRMMPSYIHRKGEGNYTSFYQEDVGKTYRECGESRELRVGEINLEPKWSREWEALAEEAVDKMFSALSTVDGAYK